MRTKISDLLKRFLLFFAIILLLGAGYFTYDKWVKNSDITLWSFVPGNSILVYESNKPLGSLSEVQQTEIWKNLAFMPSVQNIDRRINLLDSIAGNGSFLNFFAENPLLVALNVTSSQSFDFLFIVEIKNLTQQNYLSKAQAYFLERGYKKRTREYEGFTITELVGEMPGDSFTYIFYKNYFIGSFSAFLVEDAIRTVAFEDIQGFDLGNPELRVLTKLEKDQGNLYVNMSRASYLLNIFTEGQHTMLPAKSSFLDIKVWDKTINLTGFTFIDDQAQYLSTFSSSAGAAFDMAEVIPNDASWFYHYSAKSPTTFGASLHTYHKTKTPEVLAYQQKLLKEMDFDVNVTFNLIEEEIGLVVMESAATGTKNQLLILEINEMEEAQKFYNSVGERHMLKTGDSLYLEAYGDYEIRKLPVAEFPYALIGGPGKGFKDCYYLQFRNYLVFSNNLQQLKNFTISIENEATWTKSIRINRFLEQTNREANFSLFVNMPRAWNQLTATFKPYWKDYFSEYQFTFKNLEYLALQYSTVDEKFYTNITIYQPDLPNRSIPERIRTLQSITFPDFINSKPWLTTNHNNRLKEVFAQDTSNHVFLIGTDFSVLWDLAVEEKIKGGVEQIDYYKNGKLQYIFATQSAVHVIDRTGAYLPEFPKKLPKDKEIAHFRVIDYNNTKDYRYAIASPEGNVYLTDKNLKPLEGWAPRKFDRPLVQAPEHRRIDGKDVLIVLQEDGKLFLLNRRGQNYLGFPKETKSEMADNVFITNANTLEQSTVTMLTKGGEIIEINFKGGLVRREQLYKPGANTRFSILEDVTGGAYLILKQTENSYEVLDGAGSPLFEKSYFTSRPLFQQYYQLGGGLEFVVFVDPGGSYLYFYDRQGNLMTGRPLTASQPISIMQYENELQIYRAVDRNLELISIAF